MPSLLQPGEQRSGGQYYGGAKECCQYVASCLNHGNLRKARVGAFKVPSKYHPGQRSSQLLDLAPFSKFRKVLHGMSETSLRASRLTGLSAFQLAFEAQIGFNVCAQPKGGKR